MLLIYVAKVCSLSQYWNKYFRFVCIYFIILTLYCYYCCFTFNL